MTEMHLPEPDMQTALGWWSELPAKWTPVGWKDHLFRFNVLYNGMISAIPDLNPRTARWAAEGLQLGVWPAEKAGFPGHVIDPQDNGSVVQGWHDCAAPVLYSEWAQEGLLLREEIFGHTPAPEAKRRGDEPLFAWIRLSVHEVLPALPVPPRYGFNLLLSAPYISTGAMSIRYNIAVEKDRRRYPRELRAERDARSRAKVLRIVEPDGRVRLGVVPRDCGVVTFNPDEPEPGDYTVFIGLESVPGAHVDVLLPIYPVPREHLEEELALGYEGSLEAANAFWDSQKPPAAASFITPEPQVNETIRQNLRLTGIISERDPETGFASLLTGSWAYADLWATPGCMQIAMFLDTMGYHEDARRYLRMYINDQGSVIPVGDFFRPHPGSLGPPRSIAACVWTADHGAILWALANHALMAGDHELLDEVLHTILLGCDYIRDTRRAAGHPGVHGLMPPGVATDMPTQIQSVWADAWCYKGLATAARLLRRMGHPRCAEITAECEDYRTTFVRVLEEAAQTGPEWSDCEGNTHRLVPMAVHGHQDYEMRNAFYLDTGPLVLVFAGLLDAAHPIMQSTLSWFREGPPARVYRYDSDCWQIPSLCHEMSSCEPCFSWNVFHSHQSGDRQHYLEGMYSLFAGAVSRQTQTICETRGGVTGLAAATLMVYLARLAVVDDQIQEGSLHLLRMTPAAWLEGSGSTFERLPTEFGPVTLRARVDQHTLVVDFDPQFRRPPRDVVLHIPPVASVTSVMVNGISQHWDGPGNELLLG